MLPDEEEDHHKSDGNHDWNVEVKDDHKGNTEVEEHYDKECSSNHDKDDDLDNDKKVGEIDEVNVDNDSEEFRDD